MKRPLAPAFLAALALAAAGCEPKPPEAPKPLAPGTPAVRGPKSPGELPVPRPAPGTPPKPPPGAPDLDQFKPAGPKPDQSIPRLETPEATRRWVEEHTAARGPSAWNESAKLVDTDLRTPGPPRAAEPKTPGEIVSALRSPSLGARIRGLTAAWKTRPPEARPELERMARKDHIFAGPAVEALGGYPDPEGERALIRALGSGEAEARLAATRALGARKIEPESPAEQALVRALRRDGDWRVRASAARALAHGAGGSYGPEAARRLAERQADGRELEFVRLECAAALARAPGGDSGWQYLAGAVFAGGDVGMVALNMAAELGGSRAAAVLGSALGSDRTELWTTALGLFARVEREAALEALAGRMRGGGELGRRAALALAAHEGARLTPEIVKALEEGSALVRESACGALGRAAGIAATPALERKLLDERETSGVRIAAARELGRVGPAAAAPALREVARKDADEAVRAEARDALALVEARAKAGKDAPPAPADLERLVFSRWRLLAAGGSSCRLRSDRGEEADYRVGQEVLLGYRLVRVLAAGEEPAGAEALLAGPLAADRECVRAILAKGNRAVVLTMPGMQFPAAR